MNTRPITQTDRDAAAKPFTVIVVIQSLVTGQWDYCPSTAVATLHPEFDDKPTGFLTATQALEVAKRDKTIPAGAKFRVRLSEPLNLHQCALPAPGRPRFALKLVAQALPRVGIDC